MNKAKKMPLVILSTLLCISAVVVTCAAFLQQPGEQPYVVMDGKTFAAEPSSALEEAVSKAVMMKATELSGAIPAEGHKVLLVEFYNGYVKVYCITSYASYLLEKDTVTLQSGGFRIPTVITFVNEENYAFSHYKEAEDGARYGPSLRELFPKNLLEVLDGEEENWESLNRYMQKQHEFYINDYLTSIGRENVTIVH